MSTAQRLAEQLFNLVPEAQNRLLQSFHRLGLAPRSQVEALETRVAALEERLLAIEHAPPAPAKTRTVKAARIRGPVAEGNA